MKGSSVGRYTFHYHLRSMVLEGALNGVWQLNEIVARKSLGAGTWWVTLIVMAPSAALLLSVLWGPHLEGRKKAPWFLVAGVVGRLVLLAAAWATSPWLFTLILAVSALSYSILYPAQNALYQSNYAPGERGRLFGLAYSGYGLTSMGVAVAAGWCYDRWPDSFRAVYPAAGVLGFGACWYFYRMRERWVFRPPGEGTRNPFVLAWRILRADRGFAFFQGAFFCYGIGFMIMATLLPLYLVDALRVTYSQASVMRVLLFQGMLSLFTWVMGRYSDRFHPLSLARWSFLGLVLFPALLFASAGPRGGYLTFLWYGLCMAGVTVAWYMGPLVFAGARDSSLYMTVHVALTGVRALIGHPLGAALYVFSGSFALPFAVAALFFAAGFALTFPAGENVRGAGGCRPRSPVAESASGGPP